MSERTALRDYFVGVWVLVSGIAAYACLGYAVWQSHGETAREFVNRLLHGDV